jgi:hypothetical protein
LAAFSNIEQSLIELLRCLLELVILVDLSAGGDRRCC